MPGLVRLNLDRIIRQVQEALKNFPQVAGAYLFGSSLGPCRPDSDIDLGLILEPGIKPDSEEGDTLEADIALYLPPIDGHPFDIVLLDPDKPLFTFHALKKGKLIYCRNMERVTDVIEYVSRRYADLYPRYIRALEEVISEVTER
ncbi:MAG: nucleotidyltransferase domain-containing protein [Thermanaeromonas sp.]|uniref:nucleotidyltransferase domain-containing protein n=1 Tax=Thermanaeromonas sp. TaxID=2003697 RepID=UPI00243E2062|nr:nucleotidyltransferase domain-containing protein [Thermanaeromonas sp.]MCG0278198.1 nucleotidyltransferase domain-containing protein [Thermanaeromonas sp.]